MQIVHWHGMHSRIALEQSELSLWVVPGAGQAVACLLIPCNLTARRVPAAWCHNLDLLAM